MLGMTTTLPAVRTAAPGLPSNKFEVEYIAEDGTRHRVASPAASRVARFGKLPQ